jgi:uncharacterized protein (TIGR03435 family)
VKTWKRIANILNRKMAGMNTGQYAAKSIALAAQLAFWIAPLVVVGILAWPSVPTLNAQGSDTPRFEVASIKLSRDPAPGGDVSVTPGRFRGKDLALQWLILTAYRINSKFLSGKLPEWTIAERYDIDATTAGPASEEQVLAALRELLKERFQLQEHREVKQEPVYFLTVAKGGIKMPPGSCVPVKKDLPNECYSRTNEGLITTIDWRGAQMSDPGGVAYRTLSGHLSGFNNRVIIDKTWLTGAYDVHLQWERDPSPSTLADAAAPAAPAGHAPSLFDAIEKQLGLRLESSTGPVEYLVVDHVEKPSQN